MNIVDIGAKFGNPVANIFNPWKPKVIERASIQLVQEMDDIDLICFGGGADIAPAMYGHQPAGSGQLNAPSARDLFEREVWKVAQERHIPIFGVCRGAQMVCVLSGGALVQDVNGHSRGGVYHIVNTNEGKEINMSTYHHQMMYPFKVKHELIGWVEVKSPRSYMYDTHQFVIGEDFKREPEIVYFPETNALGVQAHPEYEENPNEPSQVYTRQLVSKYLLGGKYEV